MPAEKELREQRLNRRLLGYGIGLGGALHEYLDHDLIEPEELPALRVRLAEELTDCMASGDRQDKIRVMGALIEVVENKSLRALNEALRMSKRI